MVGGVSGTAYTTEEAAHVIGEQLPRLRALLENP
jgi:hypothetical protein